MYHLCPAQCWVMPVFLQWFRSSLSPFIQWLSFLPCDKLYGQPTKGTSWSYLSCLIHCPSSVNSIPAGPVFVQVVTNIFYLRKSVIPFFLILFPRRVIILYHTFLTVMFSTCLRLIIIHLYNYLYVIYMFIVCIFLLVNKIHKGRSNSVYNFLHNVWLICNSLWN